MNRTEGVLIITVSLISELESSKILETVAD